MAAEALEHLIARHPAWPGQGCSGCCTVRYLPVCCSTELGTVVDKKRAVTPARLSATRLC